MTELSDDLRTWASYGRRHDADNKKSWPTNLGPKLIDAADELDRLTALLNTPQIDDFIEAVRLEAAHQVERWGEEHDAGKTDDWWLWTAAHLATKATQANRHGDRDKYLHHIITTAALCANWHKHASLSLNCDKEEEDGQCLHIKARYSLESDNFYCLVCNKGMGNNYYLEHRHPDMPDGMVIND